MTEIALIDAARTAHGSFLGSLADRSAVELGATALAGLFDRTSLDATRLDWVALGNAISAGIGQVPARQVAVDAGLPEEVPATTVNEASGSGLRAVALGADRIAADRAEFVVAGGTESMSNAPFVLSGVRRGHRHGDLTLVDSMIYDALWDVASDAHMGELTEDLAERFDISRQEQDEYALESHERAVAAVEGGAFDDEIVPVTVDGEEVRRDEGPRADTSLDRLANLRPAFRRDGTITAGNASDLGDGASAVLLGDADAARDAGLDPLARVVDYAVAYRDPKWFGMSVGDAVEKLLRANDLDADDVDVFELNEAFAAQMVYVAAELGIPRERLNPLGGAIAFGHPIGASGGMLATTLAHAMREEGARYGVVGMSIGGGGGIAALFAR
ncbi:thiolase family protein [Halegenticoccus tardaugens]|uniref:thiolase family protein n=1 Tax=Halegenticoccus tardaugens TaxID=2071624 RepID=UPI00100AC7B3|nr:thiolase family protein [Halegenticoccus tardaugens]